ncbi:MAG: hypothetical protein LBV69_01140, partial [Bacteroidales bacterium]|nr:hypothetical protein [Bacteroidales bacterium]
MKRIFFYIIILLFCTNNSFSMCIERSLGEARKINYEGSDVVFLGIPIQIDKNVAQFVLLDLYKGSVSKTVTVKFDLLISKKYEYTLWLIYGENLDNNDTIYAGECTLSRSIERSMGVGDIPSPPVLSLDKEYDENTLLFNHYLFNIYDLQNRQIFYDEIKILETLSKLDKQKTEENNNSNSTQINIICIYIILLINLCLTIYLIFKRKT